MAGDFEAYYGKVTERCRVYFSTEAQPDVSRLAMDLMGMEGFPMHAPVHHYLVPAVLLTVCRKAQGHTGEVLARDLELALERARNVPGGFCGYYGTCGACVGVGIFWSVITDATPLSAESWAYGNRGTGTALLEIAEIGGPRCCKRCTLLSLQSALPQIQAVLGLDIAMSPPVCSFHDHNRECLGSRCPLFPAPETPVVLPTFAYPKKDLDHPCPCQERPVELTHKTGILYWIAAEGETVDEGQVIAELEVEKKSLEIPAPVGGVLARTCAKEGETLCCGAIIGYIREV